MAGIKIALGTMETKAIIHLLKILRSKDPRVTASFFDDEDSLELGKQIEPLYYKFTEMYDKANTK